MKKEIELKPLKIKDYNPKQTIAWIDKDGQARSINEPKYKIKTKKP